MSDTRFMSEALALAREAAQSGEVPVGCVVVRDGEVIATGVNTTERERCATGHAEMNAIAAACAVVGDWRLDGCEMYVTLEPCAMCTGAIMNSRVARVVYGASDAVMGAMGGACDLLRERLPHRPEVFGGFMAEECAELLKKFFLTKRGV